MKSVEARSERWEKICKSWLDETFGFLRNLLASCTLGAVGLFAARNIHDFPFLRFGPRTPYVVGIALIYVGLALAFFSAVRLLLGLIQQRREGKKSWIGWILLVLLWAVAVEVVQITYLAVGLMNSTRSVQGKP